MTGPDEASAGDTPEKAWRSQDENEEAGVESALTAERLRALARGRERLNRWGRWAVVGGVLLLAAALLHNVYQVDQPWIRLGQAWTLGVLVYIFGPAFDARRRGGTEPCARFLERQHEERRQGYLRIRNRLFLFLPGLAASWWGKGPLAAAKAMRLDPGSALYRFYAGPGLFLVTGTALVLVWLALGKAAETAGIERDEVRRSIGQ